MNEFILSERFIYLESLSHVMLYECKFSLDHYSDELFSQHEILFPDAIKSSVKKRKSEFLAGRYACKITLQKLGVNNYHVVIGKHGKPIWPSGAKGSITHTKNIALCAISNKSEVMSIGIDREYWLSQKLAIDLSSHIISKTEKNYLLSIDMPFNRLLTIIFSAKESLFKALYPFVKQYFDFHVALVTSISFFSNQGRFIIKLDSSIFKNYTDDYIEGLFYIEGDSVTTVIIL